MRKVQFVGLDVHADTIAVAVAEPGGTVRSVGVIPNRPESIRTLVKRLGSPEQLRACYEAGPTGYVIYWQLTALGVRCEVVAPHLGPTVRGLSTPTDFLREMVDLAGQVEISDNRTTCASTTLTSWAPATRCTRFVIHLVTD